MTFPRRHRRGFTLIELLVVIAIIAILVALLLPAVQSVREAARRSQCQDHLHNIGIALHNYEGNFGRLPPAATWKTASLGGGQSNENGRNATDLTAGWGASWMVAILPFVEQKPLYDRFDFNQTVRHANNEFVNTSHVSLYSCPSHPDVNSKLNQDFTAVTGVTGVVKGNYGASIGNGYTTSRAHFNDANRRGAMSIVGQWGAGFKDILDGTSNVVLVGEIVKYNNVQDDRGAWTWGPGVIFGSSANCGGGIRELGPNSKEWDCTAYAANTTDLNQSIPNWRNNPDSSGASAGMAARGFHPGGVQFTMGDGKTTFLSENIDFRMYGNLLAIADGNSVQIP